MYCDEGKGVVEHILEGNLKKVVSLMKLECAILQLQHGNMGKCNCVRNRPCKCHGHKTVFSDVY